MSKKIKNNNDPRLLPRDMAAIQEEYQKLCYQTGAIQYQIEVHSSELKKLNERLRAINNEAAARNLLDKKEGTAPAAPTYAVELPKSEEVTNVG